MQHLIDIQSYKDSFIIRSDRNGQEIYERKHENEKHNDLK